MAQVFALEPTASARAAGLRHVDPSALRGIARIADGPSRRGAERLGSPLAARDAGSPHARDGGALGARDGGALHTRDAGSSRARATAAPAFRYIDARGRRVADAATLERIRRLVIPPAWTEVWICPIADGHIQAVGRDARGRRQYRYHARWREVRDATKYHRMLAFAQALPRIRNACRRDLALRGIPREKVLATAVRILELTHIRVGHEEYTRENGSYGLTTLRDKHVRIRGADVRFHFRGKAGKIRDVAVHDAQPARVIAQCAELPGHDLFKYQADDGTLHAIDSEDVNAYLERISGGDFTAKDFRTWAGTLIAARTLRALEPCLARARANKNVVECIRTVAGRLGNTPAVCKKCYVHPAIVEAYLDGSLRTVKARGDEALVQAVISRAARTTDQAKLTHALKASLRLAARVPRAGSRRGEARRGRPHPRAAPAIASGRGGKRHGKRTPDAELTGDADASAV